MKKYYLYLIFVIAIVVIGTSISCKKSQADIDRETITNYISDNGLSAVEYQTTGLFYVIEKPGGSAHPSAYSDVTVNYVGHLVDGTQFDAADTISFNLGQTIVGWQIGIPLIGEGGRIKLLIPSGYAYGARETGSIPKNSVLIFDVDLILYN